MASLREIRGKIKSVKNTQQITKAMKMVAASRLRRAQSRILAARPFAQEIDALIKEVMGGETDFNHPLLDRRTGTQRLLLLVTSDKGLCGAFNTNLIREALRYIRQHKQENITLYVVGRKGRDYFRRIGIPASKEYTNLFNHLGFAQAELVTRDILEVFESRSMGAVDVIYNEFKSIIFQKVIVRPLLPVARESGVPVTAARQTSAIDYIFEPAKDRLLSGLLLRALKAQVYRIFLESNASELGAKMTAMDNASRNAFELIGSLTLQLNRTRQASITKEILEVVSGAEALK